ncbi:MAG TPA: redox-sensing transcriptional repressor Rex, partial [Clostridiales bacterium]|nr:redox-sensing transcriptional repressor Rex [Clostridiales bacterium]
MKYKNFEKEGIKIVAAFDIDPSKLNSRLPIPVYALDDLEKFVKENEIKIGIISVPDIAAQLALDIMIRAGIRGVLNF